MSKSLTHLERVEIIALDTPIWSGETRLRAEDIQLGPGGKLPPEKVANLGSKKIIDPEDLKVFRMLRKRAERACEAAGIRFLSGYAIPRERTEAVAAELEAIAQRFEQAKSDLLATYETRVEQWIGQNKDFEEALRRAIIPATEVRNRLGFEYCIYRVQSTSEKGHLADHAGRMGGRLLNEVATAARELLDNSLTADPEELDQLGATHKVLLPLRRMRDKLNGLSFLDSAIDPMVKAIDEVLAQVPKKGRIKGQAYFNILATVLILSDPDKVKRLAAGLLSVRDLANARGADGAPEGDHAEVSDVDTDRPGVPAPSLYF